MSFLKNIAVCYFCNGSLFEQEAPLYVEMQIGECLNPPSPYNSSRLHSFFGLFLECFRFSMGFYSRKNSSNSSFHPLRGIFANLFFRQKFDHFLFVQR